MKKNNQDVYDFIAAHVKGITCKQLTKITNEKMGTNFTISQMQAYKHNHNLKSSIRYNGSKSRSIFPSEIADLVNKTFGTNYTKTQIECYKNNHHILSGLTGHFEKGHVPKNKGKKMNQSQYEKCAPTMFKKGNRPHNYRPVGSERFGKDGYLEVKVADPKTWKGKHVAIYEKHFGPIPKGSKVIFLDRNKMNFDIENLALVTSAELARLNQNHRISEFQEVTKAGIALEKYKEAIRQSRRNK